MGERHPSRTVILVPRPDEDGRDRRRALGALLPGRRARGLRRGDRARRCAATASRAPASIVLPLAISDLPVFLRWRGEPPFGETQWEQLVGVADRVIVDSSEWGELRYGELAAVVRARPRSPTSPGRGPRRGGSSSPRCWPAIATARRSRCAGPRAEAALLRGWLASRLERELPPVEPAGELGVAARRRGGRAAPPRSRSRRATS